MKKKIISLTRELLADILFFASLMAIDLSFRIIYERNNTSPLPASAAFRASFFWCVLLVGISVALPRIVRRIYMLLVTLSFSVLALAHAVMDSFFGQYMSFSSIMFADDGAGYFEWSYFDVETSFIAALCICFAVTVAAVILVPGTKKKCLPKLIAALVVIAVGISGTIITVNKTFKNDFGGIVWNSTKSHADYYDDFSDYRLCMHMCGLYHYTFRDAYISTGLKDVVDRMTNSSRLEELDEYYSSKAIDPDNEMTGVLEGKNLILIQLESIDGWMLNESAMPFLSSLREQSVDFTGFYAPKYLWAATFSSENAVNTGMITPMNSSKMAYFTETAYPDSLPNLFREAGYSANSFHRSNREMYNRGEVHEAWGYEKYNTSGDMAISDGDMDSTITEAYDMLTAGERFMSFVITYTGHGPYTADGKAVVKHEETIRARLGEGEYEDEYVWALCHAYETDLFAESLYEKLEADGKLKDTVLFFYTDHYDHYVTTQGLLEEQKGTEDTNLMGNVPCFVYSTDLEAQRVDKVISTYDILPTIVNLFGLDSDGRYYLGNDAFSDNGGYVIFRDMSWYDGETYYSIMEDEPTELAKKRGDEIDQRLNACWDSIKFNYFKDK